MLQLQNLLLFLLTCLNILNNVDYTIIYFLLISSTEPRTIMRSELLNVFFVSSRIMFYTTLPVSTVGSYRLIVVITTIPFPRITSFFLSFFLNICIKNGDGWNGWTKKGLEIPFFFFFFFLFRTWMLEHKLTSNKSIHQKNLGFNSVLYYNSIINKKIIIAIDQVINSTFQETK